MTCGQGGGNPSPLPQASLGSFLPCRRIAALRPALCPEGEGLTGRGAACVCCMRFSICPGSVTVANSTVTDKLFSLGAIAAKEQKPDIQAFVVLVMS